MNWQIFGSIGYLSILLGVATLASWLVYWKKPSRLLCHIGLGLAIAALVGAKINSATYVNRIEIDPAIQLAEMNARQKAKEQALIDSRSSEVAQIEFAEDGQGEFLDTAGMDEADLKYMRATIESDTPEWKSGKKSRGSSANDDDSLESMIDQEEGNQGADVADLEAEQAPDPILLNEASMVLANRLDLWNLRLTRYLLWIAILVILADYLRRANLYAHASWPIPLPSAWLTAFTPAPALATRQPARRSMADELKWLTRRGDSFIYLCDRPTSEITAALEPLKRWPYQLDLIEVDATAELDDDLIFEALWYGRSSFVCHSAARAKQLAERFIALLEQRRRTKAQASQTAHLVWDLSPRLPGETEAQLSSLAGPAGFSILINSSDPQSS